MTQRFIRCQLCGMPHDADARECPVHHLPIVASAQIEGRPSAPTIPTPSAPTEPIPLVKPRKNVAPRSLRAKAAAPASPPPVATTTAAPLLGQTLGGRYVVDAVLATGGMGVVYEATHTALGRRVAVKSLHRRYLGDRVAITRFQQEALVAGRFGHPNIVEVYDMGVLEDGTPWLVMERLEGETVHVRLQRERPLPIAVAVDIAVQALSALSVTHAREILHRDLKPDNLFLVRREGLAPLVKVLDFGVAKVLSGGSSGNRLTRHGMVMGTPAYMSPEQARGDEDLDARTDLYAVGMILYETLTGRLPFTSTTVPALLSEIQRATPTPPRMLRSGVSVELDAAVMRAISLSRADRFPDAAAMLRALQPAEDATSTASEDPTIRTKRVDLVSPESSSQAVAVFNRPAR